MPLFGPPNIPRLQATHNVKGLVKALNERNLYEPAGAALVELGAEAVEPLMAVLLNKHEPDNVRCRAAGVLGKIGAVAVEPLIDALGHENTRYVGYVRKEIVESLGRMSDPRALEALCAALKAGDPLVSSAAAKALGKIGNPRAIEPLLAAVEKSDDSTADAAIEALHRLAWQPSPDRAGAVYRIRRGQWDECVRIGGPAVEPLIQQANDRSGGAIRALGEIGDRRAVQPLIDLLQDKRNDEEVTCAIAKALGKLGDPRAVKPLLATLHRPYESIRQAVAEALAGIGTPAFEPLLGSLQEKELGMQVKQAAIKALSRLGDTRAVQPLLDVLAGAYLVDQWPEKWADDWANTVRDALIELGKDDIPVLISTLRDCEIRRNDYEERARSGEIRYMGDQKPDTAGRSASMKRKVDCLNEALSGIAQKEIKGWGSWEKWWEKRQRNSPKAASPFVFRNGCEAWTVNDLERLCEQFSDDANYHLLEGHFEPWLADLGREDLATRAREARMSSTHKPFRLRYFLQAI